MTNKNDLRPKGRPRKFKDEAVLQHAAQAFLVDGFEAASYEHIAEAMGLSKPSLYNAFGNKTALFERVVGDYAEQAHQFMVANFSGAETLALGTDQLFQAAAKFYSREDAPSIGCLLIGTALPATAQNANIQNIFSNFILTLETGLKEVILTQYKQDAASLGRSAGQISTHISSLVFALAVRARAGLSHEQLSNTAEELAAALG